MINLIKNFNAILDTLEKEKSNNTLKGDLIKSAFITSTMGVSYKLKTRKKYLNYDEQRTKKKLYFRNDYTV